MKSDGSSFKSTAEHVTISKAVNIKQQRKTQNTNFKDLTLNALRDILFHSNIKLPKSPPFYARAMGKDAFWHSYLRLAAYCYHLRGHSLLGTLKSGFLLNAMWRYSKLDWNNMGHDFMRNFKIATDISLAFELSKAQEKKLDPVHKGLYYGEGCWPSLDFIGELSIMMKIFGESYPSQVSLYSLYGYAFQYADKTQLNGLYTGSKGPGSDSDSLARYLKDVENKGTSLNFTVFVPEGFGSMGNKILPHLEETTDRGKIFTAEFPDEKWTI